MTEFTDKELAVLTSLYESMKGNGFDFGFTDECRPQGMAPTTARAVLRELHKKLVLHVDEEYKQVYCDWPDGELAYGSDFVDWLKAIPRKK
jgi:hypothetical protein